MLLSVFAKLNPPHVPKFYNAKIWLLETTVKQRPLAFLNFEHWGNQIRLHQCYFSAVNTCVAHGIPSLFHILTSFVHIAPIRMLTTRLCRGS